MEDKNLILLCDHRGAGLAGRLHALGAAGVRLETSRTLRASLARLAERRPSLVLLDPLGQGESEIAAIGRVCGGERAVPVLVVAEDEDPVPTMISTRHLEPVLFDVVYRGAPVEEFELRYRAVHDERTDLLRPAAFQTRLSEHFSAAQRHRFDLALVLLDLDDFGSINKRYDHTVGDHVIARVGKAIRDALRTEDVAGRLGGDEFGVLLPYTSRLDAARVVSRMRSAIQAVSGRFDSAPDPIDVRASLGFETFDGSDLETAAELRAHAELALRTAKKAGGNRGVYYRSLGAGAASAG
jgi:diguanylate cyclase (GGDEF)-like protein